MATELRLKEKYRTLILTNPALQGAIAQRTNKSMNTVWRWCKDNAGQLTMLSVIDELKKFLSLSTKEEEAALFEEIEITEKAA